MLVQGTKACLGWDREPQGGSHACTAVVDLWLQLLQLCLHLSHKLPRGPADSLARQGSMDHALDPALDIRSQVAVLVKSYQASLQELMTQLLVHWKVRSYYCSLKLVLMSTLHHVSFILPVYNLIKSALSAGAFPFCSLTEASCLQESVMGSAQHAKQI